VNNLDDLFISGEVLTIHDVERVSRHGQAVSISPDAAARVKIARNLVKSVVDSGRVVYGINTGFGSLATVQISSAELRQLQQNLILSHAVGVGNPLAPEVVRAILLLRLNSLLRGHSGIRLEVLELIVAFLNKGISPIVPEKGSLGASGDLAPLAHAVMPLIGAGEVYYQGKRMPAATALQLAGLAPLELEAKEGLSLINGTQAMAALGALAIADAHLLCKSADIVAALTIEVLQGVTDAFAPEIQRLRPHPGQIATAENIMTLVAGSKKVTQSGDIRVQDGYSLRCIPQIHGATRDALDHVAGILGVELNSVTDNPLVFPETGQILSGGNFHGQHLALALDYLGIAVAELASVSERRVERLLNPALSGLPAFLTPEPGLNSGLMITQYTAAALVSENKLLASPASVDSIPVSASQEDHVSMGHHSARKAREIVTNTSSVVAIELLAACQALSLVGVDGLSPAGRAAYDCVRQVVLPLKQDRWLGTDINHVQHLVRSGELVQAVEKALGAPLHGIDRLDNSVALIR